MLERAIRRRPLVDLARSANEHGFEVMRWLEDNLPWLDQAFGQRSGDWCLLQALSRFNEDIESFGFQSANQKYLERVGLRAELVGNPRNWMSETRPALVFGGHQTQVEEFAICSLLPRSDVSWVGILPMKHVGQRFAERHLLPVLANRYAKDRQRKEEDEPFALDQILFYLPTALSQDELFELNSSSLAKAGSRLRAGELVLIMPAGGYRLESTWHSGIGMIIHNVLEQAYQDSGLDLTQISLVPSYCAGPQTKQEVHGIARRARNPDGEKLTTMPVNFGVEFSLDELAGHFDFPPLSNIVDPKERREEIKRRAKLITKFLRERTLKEE